MAKKSKSKDFRILVMKIIMHKREDEDEKEGEKKSKKKTFEAKEEGHQLK